MNVVAFARRNRYPLYLLLLSLSVYTFFSLHNGPRIASYYTGDEPHYVVLMKSLLEGHLYVEGVYRNPRPEWATWPYAWHAVKGPDGHYYSTHGIGLPLLASPFYVLGGSLGLILFIPVIASFVNLLQYFLCRRVTGDDYVSFFTALAMGFATLLCPYSNQFFPELVMALLLLISLNLILKYGLTSRVQLAVGLLLGYGLIVKAAYAELIMGFGLGLFIICLKRKCVNFGLFIAGTAAWAIALGLYNVTAFGSAFAYPLASGKSAYTEILSSNPIFAATGLIFDRYRGLFPYSPVLLFSVFGLRPLLKERADIFVLAAGALLGQYVGASVFGIWWAGLSLPARYLISVLPLFSLPLSLALRDNIHKLWFKAGTYYTICVGLCLNLTLSWFRAVGYGVNAPKAELLSITYFGLNYVFPVVLTSQDHLTISLTLLLTWLSGLLVLVLLGIFLPRSIRRTSIHSDGLEH
ncbi:MAG TPA: hypothetical protein VEI80_02275 [Candidatus Acidoferrales bacterium]|nr:hypothetical protein [Candidatus Acidoferrales bacterium]